MFATDNHLFVGMHRTGTSYVCRVLRDAFGESQMPVQHTPISRIDARFKHGRTIVGVVCNPLEWYVSRWAYFHRHARQDNRLDFCDYLDRYLDDPHGPIGKACESFPVIDMTIGTYSYFYMCYFFERAEYLLPNITPNTLLEMHARELSTHVMMLRDRLSSDVVDVFGPEVVPYLKQWRNSVPRRSWDSYYKDTRGRAWRNRILELDAAIFDVWRFSS